MVVSLHCGRLLWVTRVVSYPAMAVGDLGLMTYLTTYHQFFGSLLLPYPAVYDSFSIPICRAPTITPSNVLVPARIWKGM